MISTLQKGKTYRISCIVASIEQREGTRGSYLTLRLQDKTGTIAAKKWGASLQDTDVRAGSIADIVGSVGEYNGAPDFTISSRITTADPDVYRLEDLLPCSPNDSTQWQEALNRYIDSCGRGIDVAVRHCIRTIGGIEAFAKAPAATSVHHAYVGGLLDHVVELLDLATGVCNARVELDRSVLYAGCILHDIGKVLEIQATPGFPYSVMGSMLGHIAMGYQIFQESAAIVSLSHDLTNQIAHIILSHHGTREHGAVVLPMTPEAIVFHHLDMISSKLAIYREAVRDEQPGTITSKPVWALDTRVFVKHGGPARADTDH